MKIYQNYNSNCYFCQLNANSLSDRGHRKTTAHNQLTISFLKKVSLIAACSPAKICVIGQICCWFRLSTLFPVSLANIISNFVYQNLLPVSLANIISGFVNDISGFVSPNGVIAENLQRGVAIWQPAVQPISRSANQPIIWSADRLIGWFLSDRLIGWSADFNLIGWSAGGQIAAPDP